MERLLGKVLVKTGPHARSQCIVRVSLDTPGIREQTRLSPQSLQLVWQGEKRPFQLEMRRGEPASGLFILDAPAHEYRELELRSGEENPVAVEVEDEPQVGRVAVRMRGKLFCYYHYHQQFARPFFYPLNGPGDLCLTRHFPMRNDVSSESHDHPHHRSLWVAYGDVNGTDNWSEGAGHSRIAHQKFCALYSGPLCGGVTARNHWLDAEGQPLLEELRRAVFFCLPDEQRLMDLTVEFRAAWGSVRFGDTKEGGIISVRVAAGMEGSRGGRLENAYGAISETEVWGRRAPWCDYSGKVEGREVGIACFDHPSNFRHPTFWHARDYGLMTANPFGLAVFTGDKKQRGDYLLEPGEVLRFHYRVFLHAGDAQSADVKGQFLNFAYPPTSLATVNGKAKVKSKK